MKRAAFSLIELLVCIAIVSVLVGLLAPSLAASREAARRGVCGVNLRSAAIALAAYANDHRGAALLGYSYGWRQYSYLARQNTAPANRWLGELYAAGHVESPAALYCPSERDPLLQFATTSNPWLEGAPSGTSTRLGYCVRPVVDWPMPVSSPMPDRLPRMDDFAGVAVAADLFHKATTPTSRHRSGVNRALGDGSVAWVDASRLLATRVGGVGWADVAGDFSASWNDLFLSPARSPDVDGGLWDALRRPGGAP